MAFFNNHPNYESYSSDKYYLTEIPENFIDALIGFSLRYADETSDLKRLCNFLAKLILKIY